MVPSFHLKVDNKNNFKRTPVLLSLLLGVNIGMRRVGVEEVTTFNLSDINIKGTVQRDFLSPIF
jgi:hypothetical protein